MISLSTGNFSQVKLSALKRVVHSSHTLIWIFCGTNLIAISRVVTRCVHSRSQTSYHWQCNDEHYKIAIHVSKFPGQPTSSKMSVMKLPQELLDMMFDQLVPDKIHNRSLAACASVCHKWCIAARPRLFHTIKITFRVDKPGRRWPTVSSFIDFLDSETGFPKVAPLIKKLVLKSCNPLDAYNNFHISAFELDRILLRVPAVTSLHLEGVYLRHTLSVVNGWSMPRSLDELRLVFVEFELCWPALPPNQLERIAKPPAATCGLVQVFNLFRRVKCVYLEAIEVIWAHRRLSGRLSSVNVLATEGRKLSRQLLADKLYVYMDLSEYAAAFELLAASHLPAHLSALEMGGPMSMCNAILHAAGPCLTRLSLDIRKPHLSPEEDETPEVMVSPSWTTGSFSTILTSTPRR